LDANASSSGAAQVRRANIGNRDHNEQEIFDALEAAHCRPLRGKDVDLFAISRADMQGILLEIKTKRGTLRPIQKSLQELFQDRYRVVRTIDEALAACGVKV
jgi:hypothetical protein